ncbi:MAG: hypothetical protein J6W25_01960 [Bacilli bacterium]|nr:hypothetical protein [Bacilli bacterium]
MKGMLKQGKKLYRIVLSFVLAFVLLTLIGIGVYAAYTHSLHAQRTIAPYEVGIRFSSNYLLKGNSKDNIKIVYTTDASANGVNPAAVLTVCNYAQGKQTEPNPNNVTYTLSARFVKYVNGDYVAASTSDVPDNSYVITLKNGEETKAFNNTTVSNSFTKTIPGKKAAADVYELIFTKNFASVKPNLYLEVTVTPTDDSLPTLTGIFKADVRVEGENNSWSGSFSDEQTSIQPYEYDGYNYLVTGFGSGTVTITWDSTKLEMNYVSLSQLLAITGAQYDSSNSSITFPVNSSTTNRYEIQFYKIDIDSSVTWQDMESNIVTFDFE